MFKYVSEYNTHAVQVRVDKHGIEWNGKKKNKNHFVEILTILSEKKYHNL